ncbi:MAG: alpha/beta fold hydrolase [Candidatus Pacebacteria bacterium]|nr:alpha/beta fold hydrolase [Candidatus Paceibacterota bacterium]
MHFPHITNSLGERLDTLVEGNAKSTTTIIFVHGFAVDKHETGCFFDDIAQTLGKTFRIVRFDFSGCGKSEGKIEEKDYKVWADDLRCVLEYTKKNFHGNIFICAQSMGTFVTALLNPDGIQKTIFTGIPNANTAYIQEKMVKRFGSRPGAHVDFQGITTFPRSSGKVTKVGPSFWKVLLVFDPEKAVRTFAKKTKLLTVHPKQDEIVGSKFLEVYAKISEVQDEWMDGDHSFSDKSQRETLIQRMFLFFTSPQG